ncbi:MAG: hypothetical protein F4228_04090 [Acidobacteria bacterium]|nr:hypothetical protein [Acidobacteriota bacterium]MYF13860.1 hypothetical protein [Acidobacteriota bacterium]MYI97083.1 hypothetical protein [Acidobacteriota bacterium]
MHSYDVDDLYSAIVEDLFAARARANATGGKNNIRARGDGPEKTVRNWIAGVVGSQYRVTEGHVVRADGRKSKQIDIIVVRDIPTATMYGSTEGEVELVRAECVAAVGEVKSSWHHQTRVLESYLEMVRDIERIQEGLLVENTARFGGFRPDTVLADLTAPVTGRKWRNPCYKFLIALGMGECDLPNLAKDIDGIDLLPEDAWVLILDRECGGAICVPYRIKNEEAVIGVRADAQRKANEAAVSNCWGIFQETHADPRVVAGRLLNLFLADLQLHLGTSSWDFLNPMRYVKLSRSLRLRQSRERSSLK